MKRLIPLILVLLLLLGCAAPAAPEEAPEAVPESQPAAPSQPEAPAPDAAEPEEEASTTLGKFTTETVYGETIDSSVFENADLTVINVWATYCPPCKEEMPTLAKLAKELAPEVQFVGVVTDVTDSKGNPDPDQIQLAQDLLAAYGTEYPNLVLNDELYVMGFGSLSGVPATMFVDKNGTLIGAGFYGAMDEESWRLVIDERLGMVK